MRGDTIVIRFLGLLSVVMVCAAFVVIAGCFWGGAPKWVKDGGGAFQSDTKAFYAVGAIKGIKNKPVATKTADNRARAELEKILQTYSASLMRDYAASSAVDDFIEPTDEQTVEQAIKTFSDTTLSDVQIVKHWTDKDEDITYALAKLDLDDFEGRIERARAFNIDVREYLRTNVDRLFDHFSAEEAKRQQSHAM